CGSSQNGKRLSVYGIETVLWAGHAIACDGLGQSMTEVSVSCSEHTFVGMKRCSGSPLRDTPNTLTERTNNAHRILEMSCMV
ncbi:hypothetical protein SARC_10230, partial [Sphaeroforma arctica JP610]